MFEAGATSVLVKAAMEIVGYHVYRELLCDAGMLGSETIEKLVASLKEDRHACV